MEKALVLAFSTENWRNFTHTIEIAKDKLGDCEEGEKVNIPLSSQYILTIENDGSLIDGLKVEEGLSKDYLADDYVDGREIMNMHKWSEFKQATIKVYDLMGCIKETSISEREDYIERPEGRVKGTLEKFYKRSLKVEARLRILLTIKER